MRLPSRSYALTLVACGAALLAAACGDSTAPKAPSAATIAVTTSGYPKPYYFTPGDTSEAVTCNPVITAIGRGSGEANWIDAKVYWYFGPRRTTPNDSSTVSGAEISSAFGSATVAAKDTATSTWTFTAPLPFSATMVFRYSRNETDSSAAVSFICGPPPDSTQPPPTIDLPTFTAPAGDFQPGDTVRVTYHATGPGLWESVIALTGACSYEHRFPEGLRDSTTRTVAIVLPPSCKLRTDIGATELAIAVGAVDLMGRFTSRVEGTGKYVADLTPPVVNLRPKNQVGPFQWFVGDTIAVHFDATDNHGLAMLFWKETVSGFQDSIPAQGLLDTAAHRIIVVPPSWAGEARLRFWARDAVGLTSDTVDLTTTPIPIAPVVARPTRVATLDGVTLDAVYDPRRDMLYLAQPSQSRVVFFSLATMSVTRTVSGIGTPQSLDLSPSGDSLVVGARSEGALVVIDLIDSTRAPSRLPVALIPGSGQSVYAVRVMANGQAFIALDGGRADSSIAEVDLTTGAQRTRGTPGRSRDAEVLERSGDHRVLVLNDDCFQRYDVATDAFTPCTSGPPGTTAPSTDGTGATVLAGLGVYDASLTLQRYVRSVWLGNATWAAPPDVLSPDGALLYAVDVERGLVRSRTADGVTLDAMPIGPYPRFVRLSPDGQSFFSIAGAPVDATEITVVDLR